MSYPGGYDPTIHEAHGGHAPPPAQVPHPGGYPVGYPQAGYPAQQPQVVYVQAPAQPQQQYKGSVTKTRPPFPHGKHIRWSFLSVGMWLVVGYPFAYLWHRVGPTKAVSTTTFV